MNLVSSKNALKRKFEEFYSKDPLWYGFLENYESDHTKEAYRRDILDFFLYLKEEHPQVKFSRVNQAVIVAYKNFLKNFGSPWGDREGGNSPYTIRRKLSSLSEFFKYLLRERGFKENPVSGVKRPERRIDSPANTLCLEEMVFLFECMSEENIQQLSHKVMMTLYFTTGMRRGELLGIRLSDFKVDKEGGILTWKAKGDKLITKRLRNDVFDLIKRFLKRCEGIGYRHKEEDYLLRPIIHRKENDKWVYEIKNQKLSYQAPRYVFKKFSKLIGVDISPHSARSSYITELLKHVDVGTIAKDVGHKSPIMTLEYQRRSDQVQESLAENLKLEI